MHEAENEQTRKSIPVGRGLITCKSYILASSRALDFKNRNFILAGRIV